MAAQKPYDVAFKFRYGQPYRLDNVMAYNADQAVKIARSELVRRHGYTEEDLRFSLVSTSRSQTSEQVA